MVRVPKGAWMLQSAASTAMLVKMPIMLWKRRECKQMLRGVGRGRESSRNFSFCSLESMFNPSASGSLAREVREPVAPFVSISMIVPSFFIFLE